MTSNTAAHVPLRRMRSFACLTAGFVAGVAIFYLLGGLFRIPGGDTELILSAQGICLWAADFVYYPPEPLAHILVHAVYSLNHYQIVPAFRVASALWGGLYIAMLLLWSTRPAFLLINLASAVTFLFICHIEYYAAVAATLVPMFFLLTRVAEGDRRVRPWHVAAAFALAWLCHKMTLFYLPALAWLAIERNAEGRWMRRPWPVREWQLVLAVLIIAIVLDLTPQVLDAFDFPRIFAYSRSDPFWENITPPTQALADRIAAHSQTGAFFWFTLGQWAHWKFFFFFWIVSAPLGLPLVLLRRGWIGRPAGQVLATAASCSLIWTFFWHPHMAYLDWDLFCIGAIPVNLLAGWAWIGRHPGEKGFAFARQQVSSKP